MLLSDELRYFTLLLGSIVLPPNAMVCFAESCIGKVILFLNRRYGFPLLEFSRILFFKSSSESKLLFVRNLEVNLFFIVYKTMFIFLMFSSFVLQFFIYSLAF